MVGLLNMTPRFPTNNLANRARFDAEHCAKFGVAIAPCCVQRSDVAHVPVREFGCSGMNTFGAASLLMSVGSILHRRAQKQMLRTDTRRIVALMTNNHSIRDRAVVHLPHNTMCTHLYPIFFQLPVPVIITPSCPDPAIAGLVNTRPKSNMKRLVSSCCTWGTAIRAAFRKLVRKWGVTVSADAYNCGTMSGHRSLPSVSCHGLLQQLRGFAMPQMASSLYHIRGTA